MHAYKLIAICSAKIAHNVFIRQLITTVAKVLNQLKICVDLHKLLALIFSV